MSGIKRVLSALGKAGAAAEDVVLILILTGMISLAAGQIVLRNVFSIGFFWADELLRLLVLWIAVAGAVVASRMDKHISITVLDRFLSPAVMLVARVIVELFTSGVCALITWHSVKFVQSSLEYGDTILGNLPAWVFQLVLPVGFGLIAYRYAVFATRHFVELIGRGKPA